MYTPAKQVLSNDSEVKKFSLSGTKLVLAIVLASEIYTATRLLYYCYCFIYKNMAQVKKYDSSKFHNYFLTATNKINSEPFSILYYIIIMGGYHR